MNVIRALMGKINNNQEEMSSVSREMGTLRQNQKEMLEMKIVTEMKSAFDELISRLDKAEERVAEIEVR